MKERPILFAAPMVRAIREGRKTQTRRMVKPQPSDHHWSLLPGYQLRVTECRMADGRLGIRFAHSIPQCREWDWDDWTSCPYGAPGDRLWVRETWAMNPTRDFGTMKARSPRDCVYRADRDANAVPQLVWTPSIHMPRAASRIDLDVTSVRVELLQEISEADSLAEGCGGVMGPARCQYENLWESLNGASSWTANPWVWVIEFKRAQEARAAA